MGLACAWRPQLELRVLLGAALLWPVRQTQAVQGQLKTARPHQQVGFGALCTQHPQRAQPRCSAGRQLLLRGQSCCLQGIQMNKITALAKDLQGNDMQIYLPFRVWMGIKI